MSMRRTLILDEEDLIMVVKEDVVRQIDDNRGEMNRTEFVNHLIKCQLKQYDDQHDYVTKTELRQSVQEMTGLMNNFLQFFVSYGMAMGRRQPNEDIQALTQQLEALDIPEPDEGDYDI